jgi:hypothetical protein
VWTASCPWCSCQLWAPSNFGLSVVLSLRPPVLIIRQCLDLVAQSAELPMKLSLHDAAEFKPPLSAWSSCQCRSSPHNNQWMHHMHHGHHAQLLITCLPANIGPCSLLANLWVDVARRLASVLLQVTAAATSHVTVAPPVLTAPDIPPATGIYAMVMHSLSCLLPCTAATFIPLYNSDVHFPVY